MSRLPPPLPTAPFAIPACALLVLCVGGCGDAADAAGEPGPPADVVQADVETVATGLEVPWDLDFAPDGRVFVTERPGRIRTIVDGELAPEPWATMEVASVGEAGLTSIALDPDFADNGRVYVMATVRSGGALVNRLVRFTERGGRGTDPTVLVDGLPADRFHAGSVLDVGPDGLLWVTTGDALDPPSSQDPGSLAGKLLRYTTEGAAAPDNAVRGPVHALGLRNSQGLDWHDGAVFASEHGPSGLPAEGGREGHDELNVLRGAGNYGWPEVAGRGGGQRFVQPIAVWDPAIAPSGLAVYDGDAVSEWRGDVFVGALRGRHLRRVEVERSGEGWRVTGQEALFEGDLGRIRAVVMGPDGHLWITTSNRDGRGSPAAQDDRVLRIVPGG